MTMWGRSIRASRSPVAVSTVAGFAWQLRVAAPAVQRSPRRVVDERCADADASIPGREPSAFRDVPGLGPREGRGRGPRATGERGAAQALQERCGMPCAAGPRVGPVLSHGAGAGRDHSAHTDACHVRTAPVQNGDHAVPGAHPCWVRVELVREQPAAAFLARPLRPPAAATALRSGWPPIGGRPPSRLRDRSRPRCWQNDISCPILRPLPETGVAGGEGGPCEGQGGCPYSGGHAPGTEP